jgi:hypothetical protein
MTTIELRYDALIDEGIDPNNLVSYWAEKGVKVVWGDPGGFMAHNTKLPEGTKYRECPGCSRSKALHTSRWERNVRANGDLGRWKPVCRSCARKAKQRPCMECKEKRDRESFIGKSRTCIKCREKPPELRKSKCTKCRKRKPGNKFALTKTGRFNSWCHDCVGKASLAGVMEKYHASSKSCRDCQETKPRSEFPVVDSKRSHFCNPCYQARVTATERTCTSCKTTRPIERFHRHKQGPAQLGSICADCNNRVTQIKESRRKARERAQKDEQAKRGVSDKKGL